MDTTNLTLESFLSFYIVVKHKDGKVCHKIFPNGNHSHNYDITIKRFIQKVH